MKVPGINDSSLYILNDMVHFPCGSTSVVEKSLIKNLFAGAVSWQILEVVQQ